MRVIIAGSRNYSNYHEPKEVCDKYLSKSTDICIISGTANGADKLGEQYAKEKGFSLKQFPADWDKHGKSAGYIRNKEMADNADALIAFWDGASSGTKHMINIAREKKLLVRIFITNK